MGAKLARANCFACVRREKERAQHNERNGNGQSSDQIMEELRTVGIIKVENSNTGESGVSYDVMEPHDEVMARPRRLPTLLLRRKNKVHPAVAYNINEKLMMAEIRRDEALANKGRMAREYETRRQAVLQRKEENEILNDDDIGND